MSAPGRSAVLSRRALLGAVPPLLVAGPALARTRLQPSQPDATAGMIDAHIHFFSADFAHYPVDMRNAREPEEVMRARVLNAPVTPEKMLPLWEKMGIRAGIGVQYSGAYKTDNTYLLDVAQAHWDRIRTEIILNPAQVQSRSVLQALLPTKRVSAIRLTGFVDGDGDLPWLKSPGAQALWQMAQAEKLPLCITYLRMDPRSAALRTVRELADRYPDCQVVLEHLGWTGGTGSQDGLLPAHMALKDHETIAFKWTSLNVDALAGAGIDTANFLRTAVDVFGASRLMWGSDYGNTTRPYAGIVADGIDATRLLNAAERAAVLGETARRVFRI
ncbi:putative TIM-barrel fold metal-dependent hydrolase [Sphingobium sp. B2D3A]|uniref:amidohydrolase family protein n=1 Tax=unclassified Sphingobium TaxID=2611147 RepID=UPI002225431C|nr:MULTISPECIES: amidohydrolase family protein [unclassified Sphingobium]MCW2337007.1 putative TIM-barrel fold metal-dependent hydrolase [Sphingobium sp. B2D3A]MCW2386760.1 putative TIM-barrel fold metal-dependent hydrolase [Sphingobium sp. B2D3D]